MAKVIIEEQNLSNIGIAIRAKLGGQSLFHPSEMASAIMSINSGTPTDDATLSSGSQMLDGITAYARNSKYTGTIQTYAGSVNSGQGSIPTYEIYSGSYSATPSTVSQSFPTAGKVLTQDFVVGSYSVQANLSDILVTENGSYSASGGYDGFANVIVDVPQGGTPAILSEATFLSNGSYDASDSGVDGWSKVTVNVPGVSLGSAHAKIISGGTFNASTFGYDGLSKIIIDVIPAEDFSTITYVSSHAYENVIGLSSVSLPMVSEIGSHAFKSCLDLEQVNAPICTSISFGAFSGCKKLSAAIFPECTDILGYAFYDTGISIASFPKYSDEIQSFYFVGCSKLEEAYFPMATSIHSWAFNSSPNLNTLTLGLASVSSVFKVKCKNLILPQCSQICVGAFSYSRSGLQFVSMPLVTEIPSSTFLYCKGLSSIITGGITRVYESAFFNCVNLSNISLPECTRIDEYAFEDCLSLSVISLPKCTTLGREALAGGNKSVYLMGSTMCQIQSGTPFYESDQTTVYVPSSLYSSYAYDDRWWRCFNIYSQSLVSM